MLALAIISLIGLALLETVLLGAQALTRKNNLKSTNVLYTFMHVVVIFAFVAIIVLYLN